MLTTLPDQDEMERECILGRSLYNDKLKAILEPEYLGKVVAIHLDTGDYAMATNSPHARRALRVRQPSGIIYVTTVGPAPMNGMTMRMMAGQPLLKTGKQ